MGILADLSLERSLALANAGRLQNHKIKTFYAVEFSLNNYYVVVR
jgi:hypothetical protein